MKVLGIGPSCIHDPSAALVVDGKVVAAAEEERFIREKHAIGKLPIRAIKYCLAEAGIKAGDIDAIAFAWSPEIYKKYRFRYFVRKFFKSPNRAIKAVLTVKNACRMKEDIVKAVCRELGINYSRDKVHFVEHHLAHAASSYLLSPFDEASILTVDGSGEFTATLLGRAEKGKITKIKEICVPDSLGLFYSTFTEYLGFRSNNGEYKVMGMAPYGDATKVNLDHVVSWDDKRKTYVCNDDYVWVKRGLRFDKSKMYSKLTVEEIAPPREGDALEEPYIHVAASVQKKLEEITLKLVDAYLKDDLKKHGKLCFAGGCALNVVLNKALLGLPYVKELWVQPASHDAGTSLGAAVYVADKLGDKIEVMEDVYLGPEYSDREIENELESSGFSYEHDPDIAETVAGLLDKGKIVGWFQGRMEWGPRSLGNRSILGNPTIIGTADKINKVIKFREKWRPFCPSILKEHAQEILGSSHPAPFMTIAFDAAASWKDKIPEVVHVNGTCRPQVVDKIINEKYYNVIESLYKKNGVPVVINTSLNRRGEPMVCSPEDALKMFSESELDYMAIGDFLVKKD